MSPQRTPATAYLMDGPREGRRLEAKTRAAASRARETDNDIRRLVTCARLHMRNIACEDRRYAYVATP